MGFFGFGSKEKKSSAVNWVKLEESSELDKLIAKESHEKPVVLFKHSIRCSISSMAINRLESDWDISDEDAIPVYLDLINFREISNKIAQDLNVMHQSPQILIVKNGVCVYHASHSQIDVEGIKENL